MKKFLLLLAVVFLLAGTSCSNGDSALSASSAEKAVKKYPMFAKDSQVINFNTGFYEVNESSLQQLAQLAAAGMITYTTESAIEKRTKRASGAATGRAAMYTRPSRSCTSSPRWHSRKKVRNTW